MLSKLLNLNISKYFIISCLASVIDFLISNLIYNTAVFNYITACNVGIVIGFIFQYYAGMKLIFKNRRAVASFIIYLATFFLGLAIANAAMFISFNIMELSFMHSKLISMAVPFFITYFIRTALLDARAEGRI